MAGHVARVRGVENRMQGFSRHFRLKNAAEYMMMCLGARNGPLIVSRMRWAGHVARMRGVENRVQGFWCGNRSEIRGR